MPPSWVGVADTDNVFAAPWRLADRTTPMRFPGAGGTGPQWRHEATMRGMPREPDALRRTGPVVAAIMVACFLPWAVPAVTAAELPQDHEYQRILRSYLATLTEQDFTVPLAPITYRDTWLQNDDDLYRMWVLAQRMPRTTGLRLAARCFTLPMIEQPDGIHMRAGGRGSFRIPGLAVDPMDLCWWSTWNFRGNPYFDSRAVRNRAFTIAAVDMMMLDKLHESGAHWVNNARRSDFLGGTLIWLAYVHVHTKSHLPPDVRRAYETGLEKLFSRLEEWGPTRVNDNMDTTALVAAAYMMQAIGTDSFEDRARAHCRRVLGVFHPAGMVRDAGGLEASYNGIALFNLAWAAAVTNWPELLEMQRRAMVLKGLLTMPEPDGRNYWGPSHFNTRTGADSANDQWSFPQRDLAIAMREPEGAYLACGGRFGRQSRWAVPEPRAMTDAIVKSISVLNRDGWSPSAAEFPEWVPTWWSSGGFNYAFDNYVPGSYDRMRRLVHTQDPLVVPPLERAGNSFVRVFPEDRDESVTAHDRDAFAVARFPRYAAVVYTGPIGRHGYMNFAGGALSAYWTPAAGTAILGRSGNPVKSETNPQTWQSWRSWPSHAVSGQTASGEAFSSARLRRRAATVTYDVRDDGILVTIEGPIGRDHDRGRATQNGCIVGDVCYSRRIGMGERGVAVESSIRGDGKDLVTELVEVIPLALFDPTRQSTRPAAGPPKLPPYRVVFESGSRTFAAGEEFSDEVEAVVIQRFDGRVRIRFGEPQRVRLNTIWEDDYQSRMAIRNLMIDLMRGNSGPQPLVSGSVAYLIEAE